MTITLYNIDAAIRANFFLGENNEGMGFLSIDKVNGVCPAEVHILLALHMGFTDAEIIEHLGLFNDEYKKYSTGARQKYSAYYKWGNDEPQFKDFITKYTMCRTHLNIQVKPKLEYGSIFK
jgi:hypothetical protein